MPVTPAQNAAQRMAPALLALLVYAAFVLLGGPRYRPDSQPPMLARLAFNLGPAACTGVVRGSQENVKPCVVHTRCQISGRSKEFVLFFPLGEVRVHRWQRQVREISWPLPADPNRQP